MEKRTKIKAVLITIVIITACLTALLSTYPNYESMVSDEVRYSVRTYDCNYHTMSLKTKISFEMNGKDYFITGNFLRFITDPLQLKDSSGKTIGYADDSYHVIGQDDHAIFIDDKFEVDVKGNFEWFGNSYELYDKDRNKVGYAQFNVTCTRGAVFNSNNEVIATYSKHFMMNDYVVHVYDNDVCSDKAMLLLFASYASDYHEDENSRSDND